MKIAIQMDPIENVNVHADTSFDLALEAHQRGHEIHIYQPGALALEDGRLSARARKASALKRDQGAHVILDDLAPLDLHGVDIVLVRQDPPFDMAYITAAHLLEALKDEVLVVNNPKSIRQHSSRATSPASAISANAMATSF